MKGFSPRNLKYMRALAEAYADEQFVQQVVAQIPWGHNVRILDYVKDPTAREWYIRQTFENGWSRNVLVHQIQTGLFERQGKAVTNFARTLPSPQSDLAQQLLKDPYNFDFLSLGKEFHERDVERSLLVNIRDFLLELGVGFAFVGSQYHLEIGSCQSAIRSPQFAIGMTRSLPDELKGSLPTIEEIEAELSGKIEEANE
jgi:predicted nuclease of restriction endonuclease-like (RecB) superfamily